MRHGDDYLEKLLKYITDEAERFGHQDFIKYCKEEFNELWRAGKFNEPNVTVKRQDPKGKGFVSWWGGDWRFMILGLPFILLYTIAWCIDCIEYKIYKFRGLI